MKILLLADQAEPTLWEHLDRRKLEGVELVLACGDLPASYLSFLTCFTAAPILYIRGNHDDQYAQNPPEGCLCIEDQVVTVGGLRILGLGGSMRYNCGVNQYTEKQMRQRVQKLRFKIWRSGGIDILMTHSPARNLVENRVDLAKSRNVIVVSLIISLALGITFSAAGAITFHVGEFTLNFSGLAVAAIVGIVVNAILPGKDYNFQNDYEYGKTTEDHGQML